MVSRPFLLHRGLCTVCTREPVGPERLKVRKWVARHTHRPCAADSWGLGLLLTLEDLRLAREVELAESESSLVPGSGDEAG